MQIKQEDIIGYIIRGEDVCLECATSEEEREIDDPNDIITEDNRDDGENRIFCDRCGKEI